MSNTDSDPTGLKTFSGCHPYSPHCLELAIDESQVYPPELVDELTGFISQNICPRCQARPLHYPAGSRITECRCVPICGPCGSQESELLSNPELWPVTQDDHEQLCKYFLGGVPQYSEPQLMSLAGDSDGNAVLMSEAGVIQIQPRPNPGGWHQFGHND